MTNTQILKNDQDKSTHLKKTEMTHYHTLMYLEVDWSSEHIFRPPTTHVEHYRIATHKIEIVNYQDTFWHCCRCKAVMWIHLQKDLAHNPNWGLCWHSAGRKCCKCAIRHVRISSAGGMACVLPHHQCRIWSPQPRQGRHQAAQKHGTG